MWIKCNVQRGPGEYKAQMNLDRFVYVFQPHPEITGNDTDMVCQVCSRSHQGYMLSLGKENFELFSPKEPKEKRTPDHIIRKPMRPRGRNR